MITIIVENKEIEIQNTRLIDAGKGGDKLSDVPKPRRYESTPYRKWYEIPFPKRRLQKWFNAIPKKIQLRDIKIKWNGKEFEKFPDQEVRITKGNTSLINPAPPDKFYYLFYCNGRKIKKEIGEIPGTTTLDSIKFKVDGWEKHE